MLLISENMELSSSTNLGLSKLGLKFDTRILKILDIIHIRRSYWASSLQLNGKRLGPSPVFFSVGKRATAGPIHRDPYQFTLPAVVRAPSFQASKARSS